MSESSFISLEDLGWREPFVSAYKSRAEEGELPGRVVEEQRGGYIVQTSAGTWVASISGKLRHAAKSRIDFPAVGDWVIVHVRPAEKKAMLCSILPRTSILSRKATGHGSDEQLIAANLDTVFVVTSLNKDFNIRRLERYLALVSTSGATPVVLLSKADLEANPQKLLRAAQASAPGIAVLAVSATAGLGLAALAPYLIKGKTVAIIGSSGVGKSTLINRLSGSERQAVQDIREDDDQGRHTTTSRRLIPLPQGGLLIDTPGMRELQFAETQAVADTFADVLVLIDSCQFQNCRHKTDAGCAVQAAIETGHLPPDRFAHFLQLSKESDDLSFQREAEAHNKSNAKFKRAKAEYKRERH